MSYDFAVRGRCVAALIALGIVVASGPALACRCTEPGPATAYDRADAVALVKIVNVETASADGVVRATGSIQQAWKATVPTTVHIVTGEDCAFPLTSDRIYVLYFAAGENEFGTYRCRGNREAEIARPILRWLEAHGRRTR